MGMTIYRPRELRRRPVAQSTMRTDAMVVVPPRFCHGLSFVEQKEPMLVQALVAKFKWTLKSASAQTVEALWSVYDDALDRFTEAE